MLHMVSQTLCKRTALSLSPHLVNVPPANLVFEKCSESVEYRGGRKEKKKNTYWFNGEKAIKILIKRQCSLETNTVNAVFSVFTISNYTVSYIKFKERTAVQTLNMTHS